MSRWIWLCPVFWMLGTGAMTSAQSPVNNESGSSRAPSWPVQRTADFKIDGEGSASAWAQTEWLTLPFRKGGGIAHRTRVKVLYSDSGLYALFQCEDHRLTATMNADFMDLWTEDVVEIFIWPDERYPLYFEYEISPLDHELVLLVPNLDGQFLGWTPWHYEGTRRVRHATAVWGGEKESLATVAGWSAEFFIPFELLAPLPNVPPKPGTRWRANFYRCDYDQEPHSSWAWQAVEKRFHEYEKFGTLIFK